MGWGRRIVLIKKAVEMWDENWRRRLRLYHEIGRVSSEWREAKIRFVRMIWTQEVSM